MRNPDNPQNDDDTHTEWASTHRRLLPQLVENGIIEALFDLLEDGIVVHDENREILLVNKAVEELTGVDRDHILGRDCHELFPPNGLCGVACAFKDGEAPQNVKRMHEIAFTRPDGELRYIKVKSTPIIINEQRMGVLATIRDNSELEDLRFRNDKRREFHSMIGASKAMGSIFETIRAVGPSDYPVLVMGESGTGKELAAGAIHKESRRKSGPFVPVNCGALPENILESELFGHVRGAFTGAIRDKKGRFELADGGTIFLDEVGELPLHMQAKLLRVLQESSFERVGGEKPVNVDIRVIAATNRDLREMVATGEFREDLFYRLCVVPLDLPPLRSRPEDIPFIAASILERVNKETGKAISAISDQAMTLLLAHTWRGNVRELINALQFASVLCRGATILPEHLPYEVRVPNDTPLSASGSGFAAVHQGQLPASPAGFGTTTAVKRPRTRLTLERVREALARTGGNKLKAAQLLGVGRATLYRFFSDNKAHFPD
jgi:sigma-54 dependent transcriptional regulator, acetoin dehydrogenase operon transcriptional activator AcoR